jgi:hypothetical protein
MTGERERMQRKLMAAAKTRRQREDRVPVDHGDPVFCARCLAVLDRGVCPHCDRGASAFEKFCRVCLYIHNSAKTCMPWHARVD